MAQYRTSDGKSRRVTLGDIRVVGLDDARKKAREHLSRANLGHDPQAERAAARRATRFKSLVDDYLTESKAKHRERYQREVARHLIKHALPLHRQPADSVSRSDIYELLKAVAAKNGPMAANRLRAALSSLWTWALRTGRVEGDNPVAYVPRPAKERIRDRVLAETEMSAIWRCTGQNHDHDRIVRLLLLTGARREEVGSMRWSELEISLDSKSALWTLPRGRSKNGLPHEVFLNALALAQLPARRCETDLVFGLTGHGFSGWSRCKKRLDSRILKQVASDFEAKHGRLPRSHEVKLTSWVLHDLRRTFSTWCNEDGVEPHIVEALLNHVSGSARRGVAGVYNRAAYRTQKAAALAKWEAYLKKLFVLLPTIDNVSRMEGVDA